MGPDVVTEGPSNPAFSQPLTTNNPNLLKVYCHDLNTREEPALGPILDLSLRISNLRGKTRITLRLPFLPSSHDGGSAPQDYQGNAKTDARASAWHICSAGRCERSLLPCSGGWSRGKSF